MNKRKQKKLQKKQGLYISPEETWNLDMNIASFIYPRLKMFKNSTNTFPVHPEIKSKEEWDAILDTMIHAFDLARRLPYDIYEECLETNEYDKMEAKYNLEIQEGLELFAKWYQYLWW